MEQKQKLGDVNGDGKITATDALLALQKAVGKTDLGSGVGWWAANADGNEVINATDALLILQKSVGKTELNDPDSHRLCGLRIPLCRTGRAYEEYHIYDFFRKLF